MPSPASPAALDSRRRREVFAWAMYDWANSAFSTLLITIVAIYLQTIVFPEHNGDGSENSTGAVVYAWGIGLSALLTAILSPITGAIADARATKRLWLAATALGGAALSVVMAVLPTNLPWVIAGVFTVACLLYELSLGYYNAFLPEIADQTTIDHVSAWGFGLGYVGGGVALLAAMSVLICGDPAHRAEQLRIGLAIMGAWWGLFSLPAVFVLRDKVAPREGAGSLWKLMRSAGKELRRTLAHLRQYRTLCLFLLGFLFYNDGVQTIISQASTFAIRDFEFDVMELVLLVLVIQFCAFPGALAVGRLSVRFGQKSTLLGCLAAWIALLVTAYFINAKWQFWCLGGVLAMIMGGTQSVSRAMMGLMTPPARSGEFFGFFNLSGKATNFMGTFLFGFIVHQTGSARLAVLSLLLQFLVGLAMIALVHVAQGQAEAAKG